jgi:hypothetical protein
MYALMCLQMGMLSELLITHVTAKWQLPTMYELMFLQITLKTE